LVHQQDQDLRLFAPDERQRGFQRGPRILEAEIPQRDAAGSNWGCSAW
jgi:hypothetical protein